jgi:hypothetical protein
MERGSTVDCVVPANCKHKNEERETGCLTAEKIVSTNGSKVSRFHLLPLSIDPFVNEVSTASGLFALQLQMQTLFSSMVLAWIILLTFEFAYLFSGYIFLKIPCDATYCTLQFSHEAL